MISKTRDLPSHFCCPFLVFFWGWDILLESWWRYFLSPYCFSVFLPCPICCVLRVQSGWNWMSNRSWRSSISKNRRTRVRADTGRTEKGARLGPCETFEIRQDKTEVRWDYQEVSAERLRRYLHEPGLHYFRFPLVACDEPQADYP